MERDQTQGLQIVLCQLLPQMKGLLFMIIVFKIPLLWHIHLNSQRNYYHKKLLPT